MIFQHVINANSSQKTNQKCDNRVMKKIGELANELL